MEVQLTDFENAAFSIFIVLLSRAILTFGLNFYIPISKVRASSNTLTFTESTVQVDENMERAQKRDAARQGKFYFRKSVFPEGFKRPNVLPTPPPETADDEDVLIPIRVHKGDCGRCFTHPGFLTPLEGVDPIEAEYEEMTLNEVINGKVGSRYGNLRLS
jgi:glutamate--cysteine ligase catalytic subunit